MYLLARAVDAFLTAILLVAALVVYAIYVILSGIVRFVVGQIQGKSNEG
jgi:hypothetical protein